MSSGSLTVAILSDTHGTVDPRVVRIVSRCHYAVHAGDVGGAAVLASLRPRRSAIVVLGNNDTPAKWASEDHEALATLPAVASLELPGGILQIEHGHRAGRVSERHRRLRNRYPGAAMVVYGHSHRLCVDRSARPWVVNPGAAGRARTYGGPSCCVLEIRDGDWTLRTHRFE